MPLSDLQHQPRAQRIVQHALDGDRLPHASIYFGPDGVGKELFALRLAQLLLCDQRADDACGRCRSCHLVVAGNHPDLHLIHRQLNAHHPDPQVRARKAVDLGVEVIRHFVIDQVGVMPAVSRSKVFIIREADRITDAAQNALLKTLEEPPGDTYLFLLAASVDRLLATTRSRCQHVPFAPLPDEFISQQLRQRLGELPQQDADLYAAISQGSLGVALRYAQDNLTVQNARIVDLLSGLTLDSAKAAADAVVEAAKELSGGFRERDKALSDTEGQRQALRILLALAAAWYRDVLHVASGSTARLANSKAPEQLQRAAATLAVEAAADCIQLINRGEWTLDRNVNVQLGVESLMFRLAAKCEREKARK